MSAAVKSIPVTPESNLIRLLDAAAEEPVLLEKNGVVYRLAVVGEGEDPWAGYDPERTRRLLREMSGVITPEEGERLKELVYRGREESTRPPDRP